LLQGLDARFAAARLRFDHVETSADDGAFPEGESYDVVLSLGLLYHLSDPMQHLRNLHRLAHRGVVLHTLTNLYGKPGLWTHVGEDPSTITKAAAGVSWMPYYRDLPALLPGFRRVEYVLHHPLLRGLQAAPEPGVTKRAAELLVPPAVAGVGSRAVGRLRRRRLTHALRLGLVPGYYTVVAWK
jgi:SAM-dependent methyltransferase